MRAHPPPAREPVHLGAHDGRLEHRPVPVHQPVVQVARLQVAARHPLKDGRSAVFLRKAIVFQEGCQLRRVELCERRPVHVQEFLLPQPVFFVLLLAAPLVVHQRHHGAGRPVQCQPDAAAHRAVRQPIGHGLPGRPAVDGLPNPTAHPSLLEVPRPARPVPRRRPQMLRIARVHLQVHRPGIAVCPCHLQHPLPARPAVAGHIHPAHLVLRVERPHRRHPRGSGIGRMQHDARDVPHLLQPSLPPHLAAVIAHEHPRPRVRTARRIRLARPHPQPAGFWMHGHCPDPRRADAVGDRLEARPVVHRMPNSPRRIPHIKLRPIPRHHSQIHHPTAHHRRSHIPQLQPVGPGYRWRLRLSLRGEQDRDEEQKGAREVKRAHGFACCAGPR